jgi:hypothetical protein
MDHAAYDDWPKGSMVCVPHAWRGDGVWRDIQAEAQERIGSSLREMYTDLLQQPLSPSLINLVQEIEARLEVPTAHG